MSEEETARHSIVGHKSEMNKISQHSTESIVCHVRDLGPVEHSGDSSFCDGNGLLLHGFVYRHSVLLPHLVELCVLVSR